MIKLKTLLETIDEMDKTNIASIYDPTEWKEHDIQHLEAMNFKEEDESVFILNSPPMKIYKMKNGPYILSEPMENHQKINYTIGMSPPIKLQGEEAFSNSKEIKKYKFAKFGDVIKFFDNYKQYL